MKLKVLAIGTHPDDIEIGCGGTIRLLADQGHEIKFILITAGEQGSLDSNKEQLGANRKLEARKSAAILGASDVLFFGEPDGLTQAGKENKIILIRTIREFKPEMVFIHSSHDCFPDHQVVSQLSKSAIQAAGGPWYGEAGSNPHKVREVFGFEVWNPIQSPQMSVNIEGSIERKIQALSCHASQMQDVNYIGAVRGLNEYRGAVTMSGRYAESFEVVKVGSII